MAKNERYVKNIELGLPVEVVEPVIQEFIRNNNFYQAEWRGAVCWMTDYLNVNGFYFFQYSYDGNTLHMEAWLRNGKEGEMGLIGFAGAINKVPYLQKINQLSQQLMQLLPADSPQRAKAQADYDVQEKLLHKNRVAAYVVLICAACFLCVYFVITAPSGNIITYLAAFVAIAGVFGMFQNMRK